MNRRVGWLESHIGALEGQLADARTAQEALQARIAAQQAEITAAGEQRTLIADRLLAADREAENIRREALEQARDLVADWQRQIAGMQSDYLTVRRALDSLRAEFHHLLTVASDVSTAQSEAGPDGSLLDFPSGGRGA